MKKLLVIVISMILLVQITFIGNASVMLQMTNYTITTNENVTFDFIGLNQSQMYIIVFTNTQVPIANTTFTSSGFEHSAYIFIPNDNDSSLTLSIYQYSATTKQNSSAVLFSVQITEIAPNQYNNFDSIIQNLYFIIPLIAIAIFASIIIKQFRKQLRR